jgi:cell division protein ZapA
MSKRSEFLTSKVMGAAKMDKAKTTVRIAGKEYSMVASEQPEYIHRVALYVDRRMQELGVMSHLATNDLAVLTSLNIAEELIKSQDDNARLRKELAEMRQEVTRLSRENTVLKAGRPVQSPLK